MENAGIIFQFFTAVPSFIAAVLSVLLFRPLQWPSPLLWILKLFTSALSPLFVLMGTLAILAGFLSGSILISVIGMYVSLVYLLHIYMVTRPPDHVCRYENVFGRDWEQRIGGRQKKYFLQTRTVLMLPAVPPPQFIQNISFATIPGTERRIFCDIWRPNEKIPSSGLAFIYLHGSAWFCLDKDLGTRPFFTHLTAQGHLVMDVAYRLAPEADMLGMVHDVKRAIIWLKKNGNNYGVDPDRIVVGGGSAGAHLALLAAYTGDSSKFAPVELAGMDMNVCAVVSLYGPADLELMYYHTNQHLTTRSIHSSTQQAVSAQMPGWMIKAMGKNFHRLGLDKGSENGTFAALLGGHPDECPERYVHYSPVMYVHPQCPPTLLIHGEHDLMAPVKATRKLFKTLVGEKIPTVMHILPQTDHAFDLQLPMISPSAHNVFYDVERFLALMAIEKGK